MKFRRPAISRNAKIAGLALCLLSAVLFAGLLWRPAGAEAPAARQPAHVTSSACVECHKDETAAWRTSHHFWALLPPQPDYMLGDFDDATFEHYGVTTRFTREADKYYVETDGADGKPAKFEIKYAVGVEPLQQYLIELDGGRLQALDVAWDTKAKRWYHLYPDQRYAKNDALHWTGTYKNWNARCAVCHQTNYVKGYQPREHRYESRWSELTVGCEACHGAGEAHVAWAKSPKTFSAKDFTGVDELGLSMRFKADDAKPEINACSPCHSRRHAFFARSTPPKEPFDDAYALALLRDGLYFPDGQIDDEVYVLGSFLQSKMHAKGVRCSDCHDPHSARLKADVNAVCTQCHSPVGNDRFPTLAKADYDSPKHHFHKPGTEAARCVSCHMPERIYMVVDPRRDHSFRVPRPDLTVKLGTPNACSNCHEDKGAAWAAAELKARFPDGRGDQPHFADVIASARAGRPEALPKLVALATNKDTADIVRATAVHYLAQYGMAGADGARALLKDPSALVRRAAVGSQARLAVPARAERLGPLLSDPVRSVRIATARAMLGVGPRHLPEDQRPALRKALLELQESLNANADFPATQMFLGRLALTLRRPAAATSAFRKAVEMDGQLVDGWLMLTRIAVARRKPDEAERILREALKLNPDAAVLYQSLGGLLNQRGKSKEALESLEKARSLAPKDVGILIDLGVTQERLGDTVAARQAFGQAVKLQPRSAEALIANAQFHLRAGNNDAAQLYVRSLESHHPQHPALQRLKRALGE